MKSTVALMIIGRGKMADLLMSTPIAGVDFVSNVRENFEPARMVNGPLAGTDEIIVHVGSGRLLPYVVHYCTKWNVPLIQASSSLKNSVGEVIGIPESVDFVAINAPNLALPVAALFKILPGFGKMIQSIGGKVDVVESHQASKTSAPITAQKIAGFFGRPPEKVASIRNVDIQQHDLGVPKEFLDGHGYHYITIQSCGVLLQISTKVNGRLPYVDGLEVLIQKIRDQEVPNGLYELDQFLFG